MSRNTITAEGFLPGDAQIQYDQQGRPRLNMRFSNQKSRKDQQTNEWVNESEAIWFGVTVWGPEAEALAEKAVKGARVKASGQLIARAYTTKDGEPRTALEIEFPAVRIDPPRQQNQSFGNNGGRNFDSTQQQGGFGGQGSYGAPQQGGFGGSPSDDPWATGGQQGGFGQQNAPTDPPF